jgi:hypothetical protein
MLFMRIAVSLYIGLKASQTIATLDFNLHFSRSGIEHALFPTELESIARVD